MTGSAPLLDSEQALLAASARGIVDEDLLMVLRREPLAVAVEQVGPASRPAVRDVGGLPAVLSWTSEERARAAGWEGSLIVRVGREVAELLAATDIGLAINAGELIGVGLDADGRERLAGVAVLPAGSIVYLGAPATAQTDLQQRLLTLLPSLPVIREARLAQVVTEDEAAGHPLIVLTVEPDALPEERGSAAATLVRLAGASGHDVADAVFDDQLGGLRDTALDLPVLYRRD